MALPQSTINIVKNTVPLLREKGEAIMTRMYEILFEKYPETEPVFKNAVNQPAELAAAITTYAEDIDQLMFGDGRPVRDPYRLRYLVWVIENMAQKHVDAGVKPEHHPMVADALMTAMTEVLGAEVATAKVVDAWTEAYNFLAQTLQGREADIYADRLITANR